MGGGRAVVTPAQGQPHVAAGDGGRRVRARQAQAGEARLGRAQVGQDHRRIQAVLIDVQGGHVPVAGLAPAGPKQPGQEAARVEVGMDPRQGRHALLALRRLGYLGGRRLVAATDVQGDGGRATVVVEVHRVVGVVEEDHVVGGQRRRQALGQGAHVVALVLRRRQDGVDGDGRRADKGGRDGRAHCPPARRRPGEGDDAPDVDQPGRGQHDHIARVEAGP